MRRTEASGEYSAINSGIDEMMPARYRGRTDIGLVIGYVVGGTMIVGGLVEIVFGIDAEASRSSRSRPRSPAVESSSAAQRRPDYQVGGCARRRGWEA